MFIFFCFLLVDSVFFMVNGEKDFEISDSRFEDLGIWEFGNLKI